MHLNVKKAKKKIIIIRKSIHPLSWKSYETHFNLNIFFFLLSREKSKVFAIKSEPRSKTIFLKMMFALINIFYLLHSDCYFSIRGERLYEEKT
jgi:hypothetical protein